MVSAAAGLAIVVAAAPYIENAAEALELAEAGRDGWSAETTTDGQAFTPMTWVPPANNPAADFGGTPNQSGTKCARGSGRCAETIPRITSKVLHTVSVSQPVCVCL